MPHVCPLQRYQLRTELIVHLNSRIIEIVHFCFILTNYANLAFAVTIVCGTFILYKGIVNDMLIFITFIFKQKR